MQDCKMNDLTLEQATRHVELITPLILPLIEKAVEKVILRHVEHGAAIAGIDTSGDTWQQEATNLVRQWVFVGRILSAGRVTFMGICWRCVRVSLLTLIGLAITWFTSTHTSVGFLFERILKGF